MKNFAENRAENRAAWTSTIFLDSKKYDLLFRRAAGQCPKLWGRPISSRTAHSHATFLSAGLTLFVRMNQLHGINAEGLSGGNTEPEARRAKTLFALCPSQLDTLESTSEP